MNNQQEFNKRALLDFEGTGKTYKLDNGDCIVGLFEVGKRNHWGSDGIEIKVKSKDKDGNEVWLDRVLCAIPFAVDLEDFLDNAGKKGIKYTYKEIDNIADEMFEKALKTIDYDDATLLNYWEPEETGYYDKFEKQFLTQD